MIFCLNTGLSGCSGRAVVYTAGVREEETQGLPDPGTEEAELSVPVSGAEDSGSAEAADTKTVAEETESEAGGYVYVCGAVARPGVYPIREGTRVFEAIELAGGFAQDADRGWLNQAERLLDGQRLYVYTQEETRAIVESMQAEGQSDSTVLWEENVWVGGEPGTGVAGAAGMTAGSGTAGEENKDDPDPDSRKVNLNTADREQLKTLPGIGDAKADAILQYREEHGAFGSIEEIQNISGIKAGVFAKIRDRITV